MNNNIKQSDLLDSHSSLKKDSSSKSVVLGLVGFGTGVALQSLLSKGNSLTEEEIDKELTKDVLLVTPGQYTLSNLDGNIPFISQSVVKDILFPAKIDDYLHPFTFDVLLVDAIYAKFHHIIANTPTMDVSTYNRIVDHAANLLSGINSNCSVIDKMTSVMIEFSPKKLFMGTSLVGNTAIAYSQPYGHSRRKFKTKRVHNLIQYVCYGLNDYLNTPVYIKDVVTASINKTIVVGQYLNFDLKNKYSDSFLASAKAGTINLPCISPVHLALREAVKRRSYRRVFINTHANFLISDYPRYDSTEDNFFTVVKHILKLERNVSL